MPKLKGKLTHLVKGVGFRPRPDEIFVDECLASQLVRDTFASRGILVHTVITTGLGKGASDRRIVVWCNENRVFIVTCDRDFLEFNLLSHAGILVIPAGFGARAVADSVAGWIRHRGSPRQREVAPAPAKKKRYKPEPINCPVCNVPTKGRMLCSRCGCHRGTAQVRCVQPKESVS